MSIGPSDLGFPHEPRYGRCEFEAIVGPPSTLFRVLANAFDVRPEGAWIKHACLRGPFAENPIRREARVADDQASAWLPFPFTARELAAAMVTGWGYLIRVQYGRWEHGPSRDALARYGLADKPAGDALNGAYDELRMAASRAPECPVQDFVESQTVVLHRLWVKSAQDDLRSRLLGEQPSQQKDAKLLQHMMDEASGELSLTDRQAWSLVGQLQEELSWHEREVDEARDLAYGEWVRAVVSHLLYPVDQIPAEYFREGVVGSVEPNARVDALALLAQVRKIEQKLASSLREPRNALALAEVQHQAEALVKLGFELAALQPSGAGEQAGAGGADPTDVRARRRLIDLRRFGGEWVKKAGSKSGWGAKDRKSGAFRRLVEQEQRAGRPNSSAKSIRADLTKAAENEVGQRGLGI